MGHKERETPSKAIRNAYRPFALAIAPRLRRHDDRELTCLRNAIAIPNPRIGEIRWRPLELCWWPEQLRLPAKEYPELGYKRLQDKPPKAQQ
ncbi:hypothetical protein QJQ45_000576 [Haematococcus lacustris]|nr:hypothetical protein QJQ45_000576 [Haematococcus lacustris]